MLLGGSATWPTTLGPPTTTGVRAVGVLMPMGSCVEGDEHLGNGVPSTASWLTIAFIPANGWDVPGRWITKIMVDLTLNKIVGVCDWSGR